MRTVEWMYVRILKDKECGSHADYFFEATVRDRDPRHKSRFMTVGTTRGLLRFHKDSGEAELLQPMVDDEGGKRFHSAAAVLKKHWQAADLPEVTQFASG